MRIFFLCVWLAASIWAQNQGSAEDHAAVRQAALRYVEAIYDAKPELIDLAVAPDLAKRGVYFNAKEQRWTESKMPFERLKAIAVSFNKAKKDSSAWPREITVFEVMSHTANVKVVADWGMDYLQLVKQEGQWKIVHIIWQSLPKASEKLAGSGQ